jgi:hypothetical protein
MGNLAHSFEYTRFIMSIVQFRAERQEIQYKAVLQLRPLTIGCILPVFTIITFVILIGLVFEPV